MAKFTRPISVEATDLGPLTSALDALHIDLNTLPDAETEVEFDVRIEEFGEQAIIKAFLNVAESNGNVIQHVYRLLAEGNAAEAMDELYRFMPWLAPPSTEMAIADLICGDRIRD